MEKVPPAMDLEAFFPQDMNELLSLHARHGFPSGPSTTRFWVVVPLSLDFSGIYQTPIEGGGEEVTKRY